MTYQTCRKCHDELPLDEFNRRSDKRNGRASICKSCDHRSKRDIRDKARRDEKAAGISEDRTPDVGMMERSIRDDRRAHKKLDQHRMNLRNCS